MRGTLCNSMPMYSTLGIIPAYAGNTYAEVCVVRRCGDHPRVCGEHDVLVDYEICHTGSSPRMRGTLHGVSAVLIIHGIIPAYAGNTLCSTCKLSCWKDHPRVCGEHSRDRLISMMSSGSSPRMRGTLAARCHVAVLAGIIPAYAGNTWYGCRSGYSVRDHPRVCGEHWKWTPLPLRQFGSSPRMRGTQHDVHFIVIIAGIIPAYAGNTHVVRLAGDALRDHPRVCGEHPCPKVKHAHDVGSSPRMRGTPHQHAHYAVR